MKKRSAVFLIILAFIAGVILGHLLSPYISVVGESYEQVTEAITIVSVKENMKTIEKTAKKFAWEKGYYPKNSSVSWIKEELGIAFENPITYKTGEGKAYMSGEADKPGIVGYESDSTGQSCIISGYGVEEPIKLSLSAKETKKPESEAKEEKTTSSEIEVKESEIGETTWNIFGANIKVKEKDNEKWNFFWEFTVANQEKEAITLTATVEFLNSEGSIIAYENLQNLEVPGEASKTFNGYSSINADIADRVQEINIKAKREKFVQE
ncbi:MAG: hypothetical protein P8Z50_00980 [candidate division WOR-3 bacterium]|jgi:hypothetical protein